MNFLVVMNQRRRKINPCDISGDTGRIIKDTDARNAGIKFSKATRRLLSALLALPIFFSLFGNRDRAALPSDLRLNVVAGL